MTGAVRREGAAAGEGDSREVNANGGGTAWPGLCNSTYLRTCSTCL